MAEMQARAETYRGIDAGGSSTVVSSDKVRFMVAGGKSHAAETSLQRSSCVYIYICVTAYKHIRRYSKYSSKGHRNTVVL